MNDVSSDPLDDDEDRWTPTIRATEQGRLRILDHYLSGDPTIKKPYAVSQWDGHYYFNDYAVAYHGNRIRDQLTTWQHNIIDKVIAHFENEEQKPQDG